MKEYEGMEVQLHPFLTLVLGGVEWPPSCPSCFTPDTHRRRLGGPHSLYPSLYINYTALALLQLPWVNMFTPGTDINETSYK